MTFKRLLQRWGPRLLVLAVLYIGYLWVFQLFVDCVDAVGNTVPCTRQEANAAIPELLLRFANLLFGLLFAAAFLIIQFVALFWFLSRGRSYTIFPHEYDVTFDDVRGQPQVVESVQEVVKLFRGFRAFKKLGGYPPHGILFEGPPGTGKTLMAKAVAGVVGVPFVYTPATGFANMFLGVGNLRVMMLFRKAKKYAKKYDGAVIFIDEIDAVGARGGVQGTATEGPSLLGRLHQFIVPGGGGGGGLGIVNELLVQMDGLVMPRGLKRHLRRWLRLKPKVPSYNILIIGATNRAQVLDQALLRPGRFDRKIHVGLPDKEGRKDVIEYYLAKVHHEGLDLDKFAQVTMGYSPARIKNIINEALIFALQDGREALNWDDIWQAKLVDEIGLKQTVRYTEKEKVMTAVHEAGHAVASRELEAKELQIQVITIIKREDVLGLVHSLELEERFSRTKEQLLNRIKVSLAGMAAEEIWFGTSTTGTGGDLYNATMLALQYLGQWGMGRQLVSYAVIPQSAMGDSNVIQQMLANEAVRGEVDNIMKQCKAEVTALLRRRASAVERIRDELLEKEELVGDQLEQLMQEIFSEGVAARTAETGIVPPAS